MIELNWRSCQIGIWWHSTANYHLQIGSLIVGREDEDDWINDAGPPSGELGSIYFGPVELRAQWGLDQWTIGAVAARELNDFSLNFLFLSLEVEIGKHRRTVKAAESRGG